MTQADKQTVPWNETDRVPVYRTETETARQGHAGAVFAESDRAMQPRGKGQQGVEILMGVTFGHCREGRKPGGARKGHGRKERVKGERGRERGKEGGSLKGKG